MFEDFISGQENGTQGLGFLFIFEIIQLISLQHKPAGMPSLDKASLLPQPPTLHGIIPALALVGVLRGVVALLHYQADGLSLLRAPTDAGQRLLRRKRLPGQAERKREKACWEGSFTSHNKGKCCAPCTWLLRSCLWFRRKYTAGRKSCRRGGKLWEFPPGRPRLDPLLSPPQP